MLANGPQRQQKGQQQQRCALLQLIEISQGHDRGQKYDAGKSQLGAKPLSQIKMKADERHEDEQPSLKHVRVDNG